MVRSTASGAVTGTVPVRASNALGYDLVTADRNGTFFVVACPGPEPRRAALQIPADQRGPGDRVLGRTGRHTGQQDLGGRRPGRLAGRVADRRWACGSSPHRCCARRRGSPARSKRGRTTCWPSIWPPGTGRYGGRADNPVVHSFAVESLSWTSDDRTLALLGQWCPEGRTNQTCARDDRLQEVEALHPAAGGGELGGPGIVYTAGPRSEIVQAQISPDGTTITAVVLHGRPPSYGHVRRYLSVDYISVVRGHMNQVQSVLYRRRLTDTARPRPGPGPHRAWPGRHRPAPAARVAAAGSTAGFTTGGWSRCPRATAGRRIRPGDTPGRPATPRGQRRSRGRYWRYVGISAGVSGAFAVISP